MQESPLLRTARVSAFRTTLGSSALLKIFSGSLPANCAAADPSGLLCTIVLPAVPFSEVNGIATLAGAWSGIASAWGYAHSFRFYDGYGNCHMQGYASEPWLPSTPYVANQQSSNVNGIYVCASPGMSLAAGIGPQGSGVNIQDGSVRWNYVAPAAELALASTAILAGQVITIPAFFIEAANA